MLLSIIAENQINKPPKVYSYFIDLNRHYFYDGLPILRYRLKRKKMFGYSEIVFIIKMITKIYLYSEIKTQYMYIFKAYNFGSIYACNLIYKDFIGFFNK